MLRAPGEGYQVKVSSAPSATFRFKQLMIIIKMFSSFVIVLVKLLVVEQIKGAGQLEINIQTLQ